MGNEGGGEGRSGEAIRSFERAALKKRIKRVNTQRSSSVIQSESSPLEQLAAVLLGKAGHVRHPCGSLPRGEAFSCELGVARSLTLHVCSSFFSPSCCPL